MLGNSSRPAMLPRVIPKENITEAISLSSASFQVSAIVSPLIFWKTFEYLGPAGSFYVAAIFGLISFISPMFIKVSGETGNNNKVNAWESIKDGYDFILKHPILPGLYLLDVCVTIFSFYRNLFPVFSKVLITLVARHHHQNSVGLQLSVKFVTGPVIPSIESQFQNEALPIPLNRRNSSTPSKLDAARRTTVEIMPASIANLILPPSIFIML